MLRRGAARLRDRSNTPVGPVVVRFEGAGEIEVPAGTTVLAAAAHAGVDVPHYCGGTCSCGTCRVEVCGDASGLSAASGREEMVLGNQGTQAGDRLACQARLFGPATIRVPEWF